MTKVGRFKNGELIRYTMVPDNMLSTFINLKLPEGEYHMIMTSTVTTKPVFNNETVKIENEKAIKEVEKNQSKPDLSFMDSEQLRNYLISKGVKVGNTKAKDKLLKLVDDVN